MVIAQDLTFEEYNPKSTLVVPGKVINTPKFPFIDVHGHQYQMPTQDLTAGYSSYGYFELADYGELKWTFRRRLDKCGTKHCRPLSK